MHKTSMISLLINTESRLFVQRKCAKQEISLDELVSLPGWAGRRNFLDKLPLEGNGQITMKDKASGKVIYRTSFSSLFQEWVSEEEASRVTRGFENTFYFPILNNQQR